MTLTRLPRLSALVFAACLGCGGSGEKVTFGPPAPPAVINPLTITLNVSALKGVTFPSARAFGFGCESGRLLPSQTPADVNFPFVTFTRGGVGEVIIDSVITNAEFGSLVRRDATLRPDTLRFTTQYSPMSGTSPRPEASPEAAARATFTIARRVYYHRGNDYFVSPRLAYVCEA